MNKLVPELEHSLFPSEESTFLEIHNGGFFNALRKNYLVIEKLEEMK